MTVVISRNVAPRLRGFLASCMFEIAPGVYTSPDLSKGVRERVWRVCTEWYEELHDLESSIVMTWQDASEPGGQGIISLGLPPRSIKDHEGFLLGKT
ncbi:MAG: type I-E CRISPR-associated endoribonuclease Cas2 [Candidatus Fermentibacteraceae bacterium]|nr:type I-E CRISPR-associated endoribonuclease Cas2 [Candidatus Fermentibacteraceae bacterium]MBN2609310.1 type I-E CRISPR-associated endoribonuclease Cas2 [Candidatus Fermentibacteraceae bacterium]